MIAFVHEHPWMTFWLAVMVILTVDNLFGNMTKVRLAEIGVKDEEEEND